MKDRNFDDIADRFDRNIYGGSKGFVRQSVLRRDFSDLGLYQNPPETLLDAGGGFGWVAREFAPLGTECTVVDISKKMISIGEKYWLKQCQEESTLNEGIEWRVQSIQQTQGEFDLVACHAVLEWVEHPQEVLKILTQQVVSGGTLSLMVFNQVALIWKNVLFGKIQKVLEGTMNGFGHSLTPTNAYTIDQVKQWLLDLGFIIHRVSGVRVFHDYLDPEIRDKLLIEPEDFMSLEYQYSLDPVHQQMARYIHFVCYKP